MFGVEGGILMGMGMMRVLWGKGDSISVDDD